MEYLVLARKWRPQVFEDVAGQDHVITTLRNAITMQRTAHAYLFSGPRGTGKTTVARIFAKALNCIKGPTGTPCNECTNCIEITHSISIDVREIDGASNRGIDEIRELKENIKFSAASSAYKIYIIDEVHMLTKEAFNALLKTLEEPPRHVVFVFATTEIHKVPSTILSRCQHFDFKRISLKEIVANLAVIAKEEGITVSDRGLAWIARAGEGSLRDAQSLFDQTISYAGHDISDNSIEEVLGLKDRRYLSGLSNAVLDRKAGTCLVLLDEMYYSGVDLKYFYQMFTAHFMNLLVAKISNSEKVHADLAEEERKELKERVRNVSEKTLERLLDMLMAKDEEMRHSEEPRLFFEYLLVKMACLEPLIPINEMVSRLEGLESRLCTNSSEQDNGEIFSSTDKNGIRDVKNITEKRASSEVFTEEYPDSGWNPGTCFGAQASSQWEYFKERLKKENPILCSKVDCGEFLGTDEHFFRIGFPRDHVFLDSVKEEEQIVCMKRLAKECTGSDLDIKIEIMEERRTEANSFRGDKTPDSIQSEALQHPLVQKVMDTFESAEIKDVKIRTD
ncbi:MAG: DNA polymerase III subunit gamma/tau [Syntrophales bacterium]|jgi:DNA polymerase-3 subunit gamma/tau|nr:DNA polymerase III subunit gamma/tau [Syntrophales bacterium]MDY0044444.1 DNA polymerase III subunit gamma/tau [Syntrophales bacterium]